MFIERIIIEVFIRCPFEFSKNVHFIHFVTQYNKIIFDHFNSTNFSDILKI